MDGVIYFAQHEGGGPIKIGFTRSGVRLRLAALQTGNPEPLRVLAVVDGTARQERALHDMFAASRRNGEWFEPTEGLLAFIRSPQSIPEDPGPRHRPSEHRKCFVYVTDAQAEALVAEARRRADERGAIRSDVSEVVREAVDAWMAKGKR